MSSKESVVSRKASRVGSSESPQPFTLTSIGTVHNAIKEPQYIYWRDIVSLISIDADHIQAMQGLDQYSHLIVLFWMDQVCYTKQLHVPQGKHGEVPEVGMFACRCPYRPNPIGCTTVPILGIEGCVISVKGLDAVNLTPVIDIKPYTPQYDFICDLDVELKERICRDIRIPEWVFRLTY